MASPLTMTYEKLFHSFEQLKRTSKTSTPDRLSMRVTLKEHLECMYNHINEELGRITREGNELDWVRLTTMKSSLIYEEAKMLLAVEKYHDATEKLEYSLRLITGIEFHPFVTYLHLQMINHFAYAQAKLGDFDAAKNTLLRVANGDIPDDFTICNTEQLFNGDLNSLPTNGKRKLHIIRTQNLQMLYWVYGKLGMLSEAALTQHEVLKMDLDNEDCDPLDWGMRCTRLASMYVLRGLFPPARYYLSAAGSAFDRLESDLVNHPNLAKCHGELARGWINYGLRLFDLSHSKTVDDMANRLFDDGETSPISPSGQDEEEEVLSESFKFSDSVVTVANVTAQRITNAEQARQLFQHTQVWLKRARLFYSLRNHPFVYVNCVLDFGELYRFLAFYETDLEVQYNMQKRRADSLESLCNILKEVRPQCYIAVSMQLLRELAEVQLELMAINLKKMCKMQENGKVEDVKERMKGVSAVQKMITKVGSRFGMPTPTPQSSASPDVKASVEDTIFNACASAARAEEHSDDPSGNQVEPAL